MGLRDFLKKKDQLDSGAGADAETLGRLSAGPEFTFIRSDTHTQEVIHPPSHYDKDPQHLLGTGAADSSSSSTSPGAGTGVGGGSGHKARRSLDVFRPSRSRDGSVSSVRSEQSGLSTPKDKEHGARRLSQRLHLSRGKPTTSEYVPGDLPQISVTADDVGGPGGPGGGGGGGGDDDSASAERERQWEKRATILAQTAEERRRSRSPSGSGRREGVGRPAELAGPPLVDEPPRRSTNGVVSSKTIDQDIQEAIRLHEEGILDKSTRLFGELADPDGANNPLSQVLYGLALRLVGGGGYELRFSPPPPPPYPQGLLIRAGLLCVSVSVSVSVFQTRLCKCKCMGERDIGRLITAW